MHSETHRGGVLALHQRIARGHGAFVFVAFDLNAPLAEEACLAADHYIAVVDTGVLHDLAGKDAGFIGGCENKGRECRAGRAFSLKGAVVFAVFEIPPTSECENPARCVLHNQSGALQVFRLRHLDGHVATIDRIFDFLGGRAVLLECRVAVARLLLDF